MNHIFVSTTMLAFIKRNGIIKGRNGYVSLILTRYIKYKGTMLIYASG